MALSEFEIIQQVFTEQQIEWQDIPLGIGDDAAIVQPPLGVDLAISVDTLVESVHFPANMSPRDIGYRALAVNLSDMAAMGAKPAWMTLAITLPESNERWLTAFASGMFSLAAQYGVQLIGGDTTRGPLSITIQIMGLLPEGRAITRSGAQLDDLVCVTGMLGEAAAGLEYWSDRSEQNKRLRDRLARPEPRVKEGLILQDFASSGLDISDGLLADLDHILDQSQVGASIDLESLPISIALCDLVGLEKARELALSGGDDYELCFTLPADRLEALREKLTVYVIGRIESTPGIRCRLPGGELLEAPAKGYQHF